MRNRNKTEKTVYNKNLLPVARELRKTMTPQERHLWYDFLRKYPLKIYKQRPIGSYIADFYCSKVRLVIEIDGSQHYTDEVIKYDENRTEVIKQFGIDVLRFSNYDVDTNFEGVCTEIDKQICKRINAETLLKDKE
ncbi:MAG: endonuclease domain-containing protein [Clostridia bacterium]|nr:endonuclease domain-containing protein [Clostridia bacterium]